MANIIEEELIKKYDSMNNKKGYNMVAGGNNKKMRQIGRASCRERV